LLIDKQRLDLLMFFVFFFFGHKSFFAPRISFFFQSTEKHERENFLFKDLRHQILLIVSFCFLLVFARIVEFMVEIQRHLFMVATVPNLITHENLSLVRSFFRRDDILYDSNHLAKEYAVTAKAPSLYVSVLTPLFYSYYHPLIINQ